MGLKPSSGDHGIGVGEGVSCNPGTHTPGLIKGRNPGVIVALKWEPERAIQRVWLSGYGSVQVAFEGPVTLFRDAHGGLCLAKMPALGQGGGELGHGGEEGVPPWGTAWAGPPTRSCPTRERRQDKGPRGAGSAPCCIPLSTHTLGGFQGSLRSSQPLEFNFHSPLSWGKRRSD